MDHLLRYLRQNLVWAVAVTVTALLALGGAAMNALDVWETYGWAAETAASRSS